MSRHFMRVGLIGMANKIQCFDTHGPYQMVRSMMKECICCAYKWHSFRCSRSGNFHGNDTHN